MKPLRVSDALQAAADRCGALAAQVDAGAPPTSGSTSQPSAAAMSAGHTAVQAAATAMAARLQATGAKVSAATVSYDEQDDHSAAALGQQSV
jgi:acyl-coenzyme A synthetase/AMP-(fatty) acid ligase